MNADRRTVDQPLERLIEAYSPDMAGPFLFRFPMDFVAL
jgi:hypothetical protein